MYDIKQSTALTVPFFVHDVNGDAVTGLVDAGFTKRISKNGATFAAMTVTITEMETGWYSIPLSTTHSNTLGLLTILFTHASAKQVNLQWRVSARIPDDLAFPVVSGRGINVNAANRAESDLRTWIGTAPLALVAQRVVANAQVVGDKTGYALSAAGVDAIWDEVQSGHVTAGTFGLFLDAAISSRSSHGDPDPSGFIDVAISSRQPSGNVGLTAAAVDAIWDELQSGHTTIGTFGRFLDSQLATVQADTDDIQTRLPAALVGGLMDTNIGAISADVTAANNAEAFFDGTGYAGTGNTIPTVTTLTGNTAQTGDNFARLGTPAGASVSADIAAVKTDSAAILIDTTGLNGDAMRGTDGVDTSLMRGTDNAALASVSTEARLSELDAATAGKAANQIDLIKTQTDKIPEGVEKNAALSNFEFVMYDSTDHITPQTGLTITGTRSIDGGVFVAVAGTFAEIGNGIYQFDALAADTNGDLITWRFAAVTADDTFFTFKTT